MMGYDVLGLMLCGETGGQHHSAPRPSYRKKMGHTFSLTPTILDTVGELCRHGAFAMYNSTDAQQTLDLDRFVVRHCSSNARTLSPSIPADGYHMFVPPAWPHWPVVLHRASTPPLSLGPQAPQPAAGYTLYAMRHEDVQFLWRTVADSGTGATRFSKIDSPLAWDHKLLATYSDIPEAYPHQLDVVEAILGHRPLRGSRGLTVLLCGPLGSGKSMVGRLVHKRMLSSGQESRLVERFDCTAQGLSFAAHVEPARASVDQTLVMVLDEIETAMAMSCGEGKEASGAGFLCKARNRTTFNGFLDDLAETPNLVTICTTALGLDEIRTQYPECTRPGRMQLYFTFYPPPTVPTKKRKSPASRPATKPRRSRRHRVA